MQIYKLAMAGAITVIMIAPIVAQAEEIPQRNFSVMGTWSNLSPFTNYEDPFWTSTLPEASDGRLTANMRSMSELNVRGFETLALLQRRVFDFGHATIAYVTGNVPQMEGIDLAGVATDMATSRQYASTYLGVVNEHLREREGVIMLAFYPFSSQYIFCRDPIGGLEDLRGRRIRTASATHADFIEGAGAINVTIPFGEVVPALQRGVVDCAVTGSMSAYGARWQEVIDYGYAMPINMGLSALFVGEQFWEALDAPTREFMEAQITQWEDRAWEGLAAEDAEGVACLTGIGTCNAGEPAALTIVEVSEADIAATREILLSSVLPNWISRCGGGCAKAWNDTIGAAAGLAIEQ